MPTPVRKRQLLSSKQAIKRLAAEHGRQMSEGHLANLRSEGAGPRFYKLPTGEIGYLAEDIDAYADPVASGPFTRSSEAMEAAAA